MYAILRGANGRRHEVEFGDDPVVVNVAMSDITVQITMTAPGDGDPDRARFVTVTVPREQGFFCSKVRKTTRSEATAGPVATDRGSGVDLFVPELDRVRRDLGQPVVRQRNVNRETAADAPLA